MADEGQTHTFRGDCSQWEVPSRLADKQVESPPFTGIR